MTFNPLFIESELVAVVFFIAFSKTFNPLFIECHWTRQVKNIWTRLSILFSLSSVKQMDGILQAGEYFQSSFHWVWWRNMALPEMWFYIFQSSFHWVSENYLQMASAIPPLLSILFSLSQLARYLGELHVEHIFQSSFHWDRERRGKPVYYITHLSILFSLSYKE